MTFKREVISEAHLAETMKLLSPLGPPGKGGAHSDWMVTLPPDKRSKDVLLFQRGPREQGLTDEILLAVVVARLRGFQSRPFACPETNDNALVACLEALYWLNQRTKERQGGVEGKCEP